MADAVEMERGLVGLVGSRRAGRIRGDVEEAAGAYLAGRYQDAIKLLKPIRDQWPSIVEVRELVGLARYRRGEWDAAIAELEAFESMVESVEQHHVLADCHRALGRWDKVEELFREAQAESDSDDVRTEALIVAAEARADRGDPRGGIDLVGPAIAGRKARSERTLRLRYVLADLYERAGDAPRARREFGAIEGDRPGYADVRERLEALG